MPRDSANGADLASSRYMNLRGIDAIVIGREVRSTEAIMNAVISADRTRRFCFATTLMIWIALLPIHPAWAVVAADGFAANDIITNALAANPLALQALTSTALRTKPMQSNTILLNALKDPAARAFLDAVASCALPSNTSVQIPTQGTTYTYQGDLGLVPAWGRAGGKCGGACKEWVSACVLSRLDFLGQSRQISLRGINPALNTTPAERRAYTAREATYYGNIFIVPQQRYGCLSPGKTGISRLCGSSLQGCAVAVNGNCADLCSKVSNVGAFSYCKSESGKTGRLFIDTITSYLGP
jgi:hypothetical protein